MSNIGRYKKTFRDGSFVGGLITDRRYSVGGSGTTVGTDGMIRFLQNYAFAGQFVASQTSEPNAPELTEDLEDLTFGTDNQYTAAFDGESYTGFATYLSVQRDSRFWNFNLDYNTESPTFRADAGFVSRNSTHRLKFRNGFDIRPQSGLVDQISPYFSVGYEWNYNGIRKDEYARIGFRGRFKGQTNAGANILLASNERFKGIDFQGINRVNVWFNSNFSDPLKIGAEIAVGKSIARSEDVPVLGEGLDVSVWGVIRPSSRFQIRPSFDFSRLNHPDNGGSIFSGYIGRIRFNYQFTRRFFLRLVTQYSDFSKQLEIDPLLTYSVNPFTAFYFGSTHEFREFDEAESRFTPTARQFFFKIQYLVRT